MLATAPAPEVKYPLPVYRRYAYDYWQQLADGSIALGGFRDSEMESEWTNISNPSPGIQKRLETFLRDYMKVKAPITHRWAATVSYTTDGKPLGEEVRKNVFVIGGYNGTGNIMGTLYARKAA